tara:strand:- start:3617 stop:3862 length:246 start_codon:yes stop_codon:yes gene_type:complete
LAVTAVNDIKLTRHVLCQKDLSSSQDRVYLNQPDMMILTTKSIIIALAIVGTLADAMRANGWKIKAIGVRYINGRIHSLDL